jgi:hypothetical protein
VYNGYWVSFPGVKRQGHGVDHLLSSSAELNITAKSVTAPSKKGPCSLLLLSSSSSSVVVVVVVVAVAENYSIHYKR